MDFLCKKWPLRATKNHSFSYNFYRFKSFFTIRVPYCKSIRVSARIFRVGGCNRSKNSGKRAAFFVPANKTVFYKMLTKIISGWVRREEGSTAIEFALMFIPYLFLSVGIIEMSIMYASASLLEGATGSAARLIRTGQLQQDGGDPEALFREAICNYATVLIDCDDVIIEARQMNSFNDYEAFAAEYDDDGNLMSQGFEAGGASSRVLIRVGYRYDMMTPFIGPLLAGADNSRFFMSTIVLQTEPYEEGET